MIDFTALLAPDRGQPAKTLHVVHPASWEGWLKSQPARARGHVAALRLTGKAGRQGDPARRQGRRLVRAAGLRRAARFAVADRLAAGRAAARHLSAGGQREHAGTGAAGLGLAARPASVRPVHKPPRTPSPRILLTAEPARIDATVRLAQAIALRPRPDRHAGQRPRPRRTGRCGRSGRQGARRDRDDHEGRRARERLSADPRGRPGRGQGARAAADRARMGRSRSIRASRSSARASASTPAGSTSSRRRACG